MKKLIYICVTAVLICGMAGCQTEQSAEVQTTSEVTTTATTTASETIAETMSPNEPISDPEALIGEYLDYFESNKDEILYSDTEKYRIHFYQTYGSDEPEMVVELQTSPDDSGYEIYRKYYGKCKNKLECIALIPEFHDKPNELRDYSDKLFISENGEHYVIVTSHVTTDENEIMSNEIYHMGEKSSMCGRSVYYADTPEKLEGSIISSFVFTVKDDNTREYEYSSYPDNWSEGLKNPETGKYELYVYTDELIDTIGNIEVIGKGRQFPWSCVSKETYYSAWDKYTADLTEVSDTVKYSSGWMGTDDKLDKTEIVKGACGALFAEETTTVSWHESKDDENAEFVYNTDGSIEYLGPCEPTSKLPEGEAGEIIKCAMAEANVKTHGCFAYNDLDRDGSYELFVLLPAETSYSYNLVFVNDNDITLLEEHVLGIDRMSAGTQVFYACVGFGSMGHAQAPAGGCYTFYNDKIIDVSGHTFEKNYFTFGFVANNLVRSDRGHEFASRDNCYLLYWDGDNETLRPYKTERLTAEQLAALDKDNVVSVKNPDLIVRRKDVVHLSEKDDTAPEGVRVTTYIIEDEKITRKYDWETNYDVDNYGVYYEDYPIYEVE